MVQVVRERARRAANVRTLMFQHPTILA
jgi:hypothetical protein